MTTDEVKNKTWRSKLIPGVAVVFGLILLFLPIVFGLFRHFILEQPFSGLGEFGDFVGGFANPMLALLGYLALLYTILLQRDELSLSREELKMTRQELERSASALEAQTKHFDQQNLSQAFFDLFQMYNSVVASIVSGAENKSGGKAALESYCNQFTPLHWADVPWRLEDVVAKHKELNDTLGNYFRVIYRMYAYLNDTGKKGEFFADMFRAQLTTSELHLLFFNCISPVGKPMEKYAVKFELFDNMPVPSGDSFHVVAKALDKNSFGKNVALKELWDR